ncbi:MAG: type II secretion system protein GspG [Planctomycetes bacterium]|nr:type II secretion system protein GspG [Planctomycetota bacterium]
MESRQCPACQADVPANDAVCPRCGVPAPSSSAAAGAKKRWPAWAWILIGVGCGCPAAIVVLGLLATLIVPNVMEKFRNASTEKARTDIAVIVNSLNEYAIRNAGQYPESLEILVVPDENGYRYLATERLPLDPWKQPYHYEPPPADAPELGPHVWSHGRDGEPGGDDDIDNRTMDDG